MKNIHKILLALVFLLAGIMVLVLTAQQAGAAKTITVDDDGGAYYTKIQDAVNVSEDGDTIRVYEGTYYENIVVNKSVSLIGNSSANTTIDGRGDEDVVQITADWVKMSGFMVTRSGSGWDDAGIKVESDHNNIFENTCSDNYNGIYLYRSDSNTLNNNTCSNNGDDGISLWDSVNNTLNNNTCSDNGYGISLSDSDGNTLNNNTCNSNNYYSISLGDSAHNSLSNNKMIENGIFIRGNSIKHWNTQIIDTTNTVNGKPLCYYKNATGFTVPSGAGQVILANCTEMVVENQNLSNGSIGIQLGFSSNVIISNNTCSNNSQYGIRLDHSDHNTLFNNTCSNNYHGIYIEDSDHNTLSNNTCSNNGYGIYLRDSDSNTLTNNTCSNNNAQGIYLYRSDSNTFTNNTCENNGSNGIYLSHSKKNTLTNNNCSNNSEYGIYLWYSKNNILTNNTCSNNGYGIYLRDSDSNTLTNNTISGNIEGIRLERSSEGNVAHYNNIYNNTEYGINAAENNGCTISATNNWWDDPSGPYHPVNNSEGKGDTVTDYVIFNPWLGRPGDYFHPTAIIDSVSPDYVLEGDEVHFLGHGKAYNLIIRYSWRSSINEEFYNGTNSSFAISNLSNGTHTLYLMVQDDYGVWSEEVSTTLTINGKPVAKIISILPNPAVEGQTITFMGGGTDDGTLVRFVWRTDEKELHNGTETFFSLSNLSNGTHTIYLKVQDNYGVWSEEVNTTLTINGKPVAKIIDISPNPAIEGETVTFTGEGTDDGSVVKYLWRTDDKVLYNGMNSTFSLSTLSVGNHTIYLKVQDDLGAWSEEVNTALTITPNKIPTVSIASPKDGDKLKGTVTITGTASDEDGTVEKVEISISGGPWLPAIVTESWSLEWNTKDLENGDYTIKVRSYDGNNYSQEKSLTIKVENKDEGGGGGLIPGFEAVALVGAVMFSAAAFALKKRP